jgi:hypothetical protein
MKKTLTLIFAVLTIAMNAQTTADFENFNLAAGSSLNGSDGSGGFQLANAFLPNDYNSQWSSWSGFAISTMQDTTTAGYLNDLSAITGSGYNSLTYAAAYLTGEKRIALEGDAAGGIVNGFYITNSTYAYLSMRDGDAFSKKFGGITGDDSDFFLLTIKKYKDGVLGAETVEFYLADFRSTDNSQDYIVNTWEYVDLTSLGDVDSLSFNLSSSDNNAAGMLTPAYFCMDDFTTADYMVSTTGIEKPSFDIFPNPTTEFIIINGIESANTTFIITNMNGQIIKNGQISDFDNRVLVGDLVNGNYVISVDTEAGIVSEVFVKR